MHQIKVSHAKSFFLTQNFPNQYSKDLLSLTLIQLLVVQIHF